MGALREPTYRLYSCQRCGVQVRICARCDHGNIYCAGECSGIRRRESLRRAQARYQRSRRGATLHAARQRTWRARRWQEVTHQGCASGARCGSVSAPAMLDRDRRDEGHQVVANSTTDSLDPLARCAFCAAPLPVWTRLGRWPWSG